MKGWPSLSTSGDNLPVLSIKALILNCSFSEWWAPSTHKYDEKQKHSGPSAGDYLWSPASGEPSFLGTLLIFSLSGIPETHPGIMASLNALNHSILCVFTWDVDRDKIMSLTYQNLALRTLEIIQRWTYQRSILLLWVMIVYMSRI